MDSPSAPCDNLQTGKNVGKKSVSHNETINILFISSSDETNHESYSFLDRNEKKFDVHYLSPDSDMGYIKIQPDVIVLKDCWTPGTGETLLASLYEQYSDFVLLAVVSPDVEIGLLESVVDEILVEPVIEWELLDAISRLLRPCTYEELLDQHFILASKLAALEADQSIEQLETDERYSLLSEKREKVEARWDELVTEHTDKDFNRLFKEFGI